MDARTTDHESVTMSWHITRKRLWIVVVALFAAVLALALTSCEYRLTGDEEKKIAQTTGVVSGLFGLPPYVGESIAMVIMNGVAYVMGNKRGRKKERACQVQRPSGGGS